MQKNSDHNKLKNTDSRLGNYRKKQAVESTQKIDSEDLQLQVFAVVGSYVVVLAANSEKTVRYLTAPYVR
jgi:hypothetical protein